MSGAEVPAIELAPAEVYRLRMRGAAGSGSSGASARGPLSVASLLASSPMLSARSANITLADWQRAVGERLARKAHPDRIERRRPHGARSVLDLGAGALAAIRGRARSDSARRATACRSSVFKYRRATSRPIPP